MKRFSKIFCVALMAIILGSINQNWSLINTASAETKHEAILSLCEANGTKNIHTIKISGLPPGATVADYDGTCYSKVIDLIFNFYNKHFLNAPVQRTYVFSGVNPSIDGTLNLFGICDNVHPIVWAVGCTTYQSNDFRGAIPDNTNFDLGSADIDAIKAAIESPQPPIVIVDPDVPPDYYPANDSLCDAFGFNLLIPSTWLPTFNCWIVALISKVVGWGVGLMSLLIEPGFWGGISINPAVTAGFAASIELVNIIFSVALVIMAIGTILNLKSYKINDLITKFIIVALLINFTLVIAGSILDLANYLSLFFLNLTAKSAGGGIVTAWNGIFSGIINRTPEKITATGILLGTILINILLLIAMIWAFGSIIISLFKRGFILIFLLIISPFAVVASLLPGKGADQWKKWKDAFLKYTFYGVYVTAGLYLGTVMLLSLCESLNTTSLASHPEMGFMSGLMVPIMAAGFLIYIVLLADELAGGSAKAAAEGASKLALGLAGGAALVGATGIANKIGTSKQVSELATNLSKKGGLSAALGTRLASFSQSSKNREQESRKAVEAKLATMNPDAYKDKVGNLLERVGRHERLSTNDQIYLAAGLNALPDKQRRALSSGAQTAIPQFTDDMFKTGILTKPEQKAINAAVPSLAGIYSIIQGIQKAGGIAGGNTSEIDKAITDDLQKVVDPVKNYRSDSKRTDDPIQTLKDVNRCITGGGATGEEKLLGPKLLESFVLKNTPSGFCNMIEHYSESEELNGTEGQANKQIFFDTLAKYFEDERKSNPRGASSVQSGILDNIERMLKPTGKRPAKAIAFRVALEKRGYIIP